MFLPKSKGPRLIIIAEHTNYEWIHGHVWILFLTLLPERQAELLLFQMPSVHSVEGKIGLHEMACIFTVTLIVTERRYMLIDAAAVSLTKGVLVFPTTHSYLSTTTISLPKLLSMEAMFDHSSGFSIEGNNTFNHVPGNQVNGTINARVVNLNAGQAVAKRTEYDQFREVIRGDMIKAQELGSAKLSEWDWEWQNRELAGQFNG
ncbi:hypothetical protein MPER_08315 [Moniliophthora perniciosa FA553]|nr:hypothetical protein MPER_08315 [Moniliophthora perniciosa FA553]